MRRLYQAILRLYPAEHRAAFASEMMATFDQAAADRRPLGYGPLCWFVLRELGGLSRGLFTEWSAKWVAPQTYITSRSQAQDQSGPPAHAEKLQDQRQKLIRCMEHAIANHDFTKARFYSIALDRLTHRS